LSSDSNNFRQKGAEDVITEQLQKVIDIKKERGEIEEDFKGEIVTFNTENVQEIAEKYNVPVESLIDPDTGDFSAEGSYLSDQGVILMSDKAAEGVLEHEGLHNYLNIALNKEENKDVVFSLANSLMEKMEKINPEAAEEIKNQLKKYEDDPNYTAQQVAEETLTFMRN